MRLETRVGDLFDKLEREEERESVNRNFLYKKDRELESIFEEYFKWLKSVEKKVGADVLYEFGIKTLKRYGSESIQKFVLGMGNKENPIDQGIFISSLINISPDTEFNLFVRHLSPLDCFGFRNRKNIKIFGDVGDQFGRNMESGFLEVFGNVGYGAGNWMEGGKIRIYGNVGDELGAFMGSGKIEVYGNAGIRAGTGMRDGEILIRSWRGELMRLGPHGQVAE